MIVVHNEKSNTFHVAKRDGSKTWCGQKTEKMQVIGSHAVWPNPLSCKVCRSTLERR
jgi:hypothetical protein